MIASFLGSSQIERQAMESWVEPRNKANEHSDALNTSVRLFLSQVYWDVGCLPFYCEVRWNIGTVEGMGS